MSNISPELQCIIAQMLKPLNGLKFNLVIEGLSGYKIIPYNPKDPQDLQLLKTLTNIATKTGNEINTTGIEKMRPNEAGNEIEKFIKNAMINENITPQTPLTQSGKRKAAGYPDIEFKDQFNRTNYLECKTYNTDSENSAFRSFFVSPSQDFKVTENAHHFLLSYEMYNVEHKNNKNIYKCKS